MGESCDADLTGGEFNPLFEKDKYGNPNPYQDPARGRIVTPPAGEDGEITLDGSQTLL